MNSTISAVNQIAVMGFLRHIPTFAVKRAWRYTLAVFNLIVLMLEQVGLEVSLAR